MGSETTSEVPDAVSTLRSDTSNKSKLDEEDLILVIGVGAAAGLIFIILIILIAVLCFRQRKHKRGTYFIPPMAFKRESLDAIAANHKKLYQGARNQRNSSSLNRSSSDPSLGSVSASQDTPQQNHKTNN